ncbi:hypothetical protein TrVE_jg2687 [Triparma verrucosa]|uniref:1-alkyl-2-acetylglycerophosphocholine esterase n=1 Tax=Triparma verrucosa TaxID=1606542 RepID=A0A9W7BMT6_9STRA|nr:hypothetical protein TrVE_jg2687 [Triparma verrucosa]
MYYPSKANGEAGGERAPWLPSYAHAGNWSSFVKLPYHLLGGFSRLFFRGATLRSPTRLPPELVEVEGDSSQLPLIILSHGLASWGNHYSSLCSYLASFGYIVITLDHTDGSATVASLEDGPKQFEVVDESKANIENFKRRRGEQLEQRIRDVSDVWNFVKHYKKGDSDDSIVDEVLSKTGKEEFIVAGHSFGGGTAYACLESPLFEGDSCRAGLLFDPWLDAFKWSSSFKDWKNNQKEKIILTCDKGFISSTDKWRVQLEPISEMDNTVKVRYLGMDHIDVCDVPLMLPISTQPDSWFIENMWECKEFLKRIGMHVNEDVAKDLDEKRADVGKRCNKSYKAPF